MHVRRVVAGVAAVAGVALAGSPALPGPARAAAAEPAAAEPQVLVVGDSLAVGTEPFLGGLLRDHAITWDAVSGRTTPQGLQALRARLAEVRPETVVVSLGTNDGSDPARFAWRIRRVLDTIPGDACVVWPTVVRPPRKGAYAGLNRVLRATARREPRLRVVNWDHAVLRGSVLLPDLVHPDEQGFLYRSRMFAHAVRQGCASDAASPGGAASRA